jgi:hypothetical protein
MMLMNQTERLRPILKIQNHAATAIATKSSKVV